MITQSRSSAFCKNNNRLCLSVFIIIAFHFLTLAKAEPIYLRACTINPESSPGLPASKSAGNRAFSSGADRDLFLIQCRSEPSSEWISSLEKAGAIIRFYIPENAYLIEINRAAYQTLTNSVSFAFLTPFKPEWRMDDSIVESIERSERSRRSDSLNSEQTSEQSADSDGSLMYKILLFDKSKADSVQARIEETENCRVVSNHGAVIQAYLTLAGCQSVAQLADVHWIEPYVAPMLDNDVAIQSPRMNVETVWPGGSSELGLTGAGQVVGVADTGLDTGNLSTLHSDVRGRVLSAYGRERKGDWSDFNGHGTHVVGSVLGNGSKSNGRIKGTAYAASLVIQSLMRKNGELYTPDDLTELFSEAYTNQNGRTGARIHSNSWSGSKDGRYSIDAQAVDSFLFDHPDLTILFSAGNAGVDSSPKDGVIDSGSMAEPASSKNCIAVGASENYRTSGGYSQDSWGEGWSSNYPNYPISGDYISRPFDGNHQGMAAFSSRGPCQDGRIKPDIVAPGTDILSLKSSSSFGDNDWGSYNNYYCYKGGTSMSTPLVAGSAALVRQWLQEKRSISNPDGATVKALLLAGAQSLYPGQYGSGRYLEIPSKYPNNVEGWGQINIGRTLSNDNGILVYDGTVIAHGESQTYRFTVQQGSSVSVLMAYADAPASPSASRALVNNLDLTVTTPNGSILYPNSGTSSDSINNVEGIRIVDASAGSYTMTVKATKITMGMDPTLVNNRSLAIRYSLVVNGATDVSAPSNDNFANAYTISGTSGSTSGTNVNATRQSGEPTPSAQSSVGASVWWKWTAPSSGTFQFATSGSSFDTVLAIYAGSSLSSLSEVVSDDDNGDGNNTSRCSFTATAGTTYRIMVAGYSTNTGSISLSWSGSASSGTLQDAVDNYTLTFTTGGDGSWYWQSSESSDGVDAARSGRISHRGETWMQAAGATGAGIVTFRWKVSSEKNWDWLSFYVDGNLKMSRSGPSTSWRYEAFRVGSGTHTFKWVYSKDGSDYFTTGSDCAWVDQVRWTPVANLAPVYRFYSPGYKGHFFTMNEGEMRNLIDSNPNWRYEGVAYFACPSQSSGTTGLYRFYSSRYRGHFYTRNYGEYQNTRRNPNWKYESIAYYIRSSSGAGSTPIYRFWSKNYKHHFYTANYSEYQSTRRNPNWKYENIAFYAWKTPDDFVSAAANLAESLSDEPDANRGADMAEHRRSDSACQMDERWALTALPSDVAIAVPGVTDVDGVLVETREVCPDASELEFHAESTELGSPVVGADKRSEPSASVVPHFRLTLPPGVWNASLWNAANGIVADETAKETFPFDLPANGVWLWLRVRDATDEGADDAWSVWLRAE